MTNISLDNKLWQWIAMIFLAFIWGASFILMKFGLNSFNYIQVGAARIFLSFLILLPLSIKNLKLVNKKNVLYLIVCGLIGNLIPAILFSLSETKISSSLAGILNGLSPFFVLLVGVFVFKNKPSILQYIGISIGFIGAIILISNGNFTSFESLNIYALFIVLATLMYGFNTNIIRFKLTELNGVQITSLVFFFMGPIAGTILLCTDLKTSVQDINFSSSFIAILLLAIFGSVLSLFVYNNLIHKAGAIFASSVTYIIPFFALMWGVVFDEKINSLHIFSLLIILTGVYLSSLRNKNIFKLKRNS